MNEIAIPPASLDYKDRSAGLIAFGILEILIGVVCIAIAVLMLIVNRLPQAGLAAQLDIQSIIPTVLFYLILAATFIVLGVGSIQARRWARDVLLVLGAGWMIVGLVSCICYAVIAPRILRLLPIAIEARQMVFAATLASFAVIMIVTPAALVAFYQSRHVRKTCDARANSPSWTERCPLPLLGLALWLGFSAVGGMISVSAGMIVLPCFGEYVSGIPAMVGMIFLSLAGGWSARSIYRKQIAGWWVALAMMMTLGASTAMTFLHADPLDMYRLMGYSDQQLLMVSSLEILEGRKMLTWFIVGFVPLLCFLFYTKRFFFTRTIGTTANRRGLIQ